MSRAFVCVQLLLAAALIVLPYQDLFVHGPFAWSMTLPRAKQGGLEALALLAFCLVIGISKIGNLTRGMLILLVGLIYLRLHHVDVQILSALLYVEALIAIGSLPLRHWRRGLGSFHTLLVGLLCGLAFEAILVSLFSFAGWAYPAVIYVTVIMLGIAAAVFARRRPLFSAALSAAIEQPLRVRLVFMCLYATALVMAAKLYMISDFDSMWYGLRTNYVLGQGGSVFADLDLAHFVFYYPKLYEFLIFPLAGFGDEAFLGAFNVCVYALILLTAYGLLRMVGIGKAYAALATLTVGWLPAVASSALMVKPDLLTALILLIALCYCVRTVIHRYFDDLLVAFAALALALGGKLVSVPYGGILAICLMGAITWGICRQGSRRYLRAEGAFHLGHGSFVFALGLCGLIAVSYRTYHLTGLPIIEPEFLVDWMSHLGFSAHFPYAVTFASDGWHFSLSNMSVWWQMLFTPSVLPHIVMIWVGNVYLLTLVILLTVLWAARRRKRFLVLLGFTSTVFAFALATMAFYGDVRGGDGNYYDLPLICLTGITAASYAFLPSTLRTSSVSILCVVVGFHAFTWFESSPIWKSGTDAFSLNPFQSVFVSGARVQTDLKMDGLADISQLMTEASIGGHCTALADGTPTSLFLLPCAVESTVALRAVSSSLVTDAHSVANYVSGAHFDFILITKSGTDTPLSRVFTAYAKIPGVYEHDDLLYKALDLRGATKPLPILEEGPEEEGVPLVIRFATIASLHTAEITKIDESREPWRTSLLVVDKHTQQYMWGGDNMAIRNGASITFPIGQFPDCHSIVSFKLGLLPLDQVLGRETGGLRVSVMDMNMNTHVMLASAVFTVPKNGFTQVRWPVDVCRHPSKLGLMFFAIPVDESRPASIMLADPGVSLGRSQDRVNGAAKRP